MDRQFRWRKLPVQEFFGVGKPRVAGADPEICVRQRLLFQPEKERSKVMVWK
jgi:hypothetical protein